MTQALTPIYIFIYTLTIIYFVVLGCYMLAQKGSMMNTHGELQAKKRMTQTVGIFMLLMAFEWLICLPSLLFNCDGNHISYKICFLVTLTLLIPMYFVVMHAIVQKNVNDLRWVTVLGTPFLFMTVFYIMFPYESNIVVVHLAGMLAVICMVFFVVKYISEYRIYIRRIQSEYSDISNREMFWAWWCFFGLIAQGFIYVVYMFNWTPILEIIYMIISIINAAYICYCVCKQEPLDAEVIEETVPETSKKNDNQEKAFYTIIENKLETLCEKKLLYLDPDLTLETLCKSLSVGRTYLGLYFRSRDTSFYQYINTLRVGYAVNLMRENPDMPIHKVSSLSGFRTQTTFRKIFQQEMGCLPSELKHNE